MTEHLAMVLCLQAAEDYETLMKRVTGRSSALTPGSIMSAETYLHPKIMSDRNALNLYSSIVRNYRTNLEFLRGKTYG